MGSPSASIVIVGSTTFAGCTPIPGPSYTLVEACSLSGYIENSGESFLSPLTEDLISVALYLQGYSSYTGIFIQLLSGSFEGSILSSTPTVTIPAGMSAQWVNFTFVPIKLQQGTTYYLLFMPGTGYTYSPYLGECGYVYSEGTAYFQGSPSSSIDYSLRINFAKHCGNGVLDPSYGEVCDGGTACNSDCHSCLAGYQPASSVNCSVINTCSAYGCASGSLVTSCSQPGINLRNCTCPLGYSTTSTTSDVYTVLILGNSTFGGCYEIDYCSLAGCVDNLSSTSTSCVNIAPTVRSCDCPMGYSAVSTLSSINSVTLTNSNPFNGCYLIDECNVYGCSDIMSNTQTTCQNTSPNNRQCTCSTGYSAVSSSVTDSSIVISGGSTFSGCYPINTCQNYGCTSGSLETSCSQPGIDLRTCSCPIGYSTVSVTSATNDVTLTGNDTFTGCYLINTCTLYHCNSGLINTMCTQPGPNNRTCSCPPGYSAVSSLSAAISKTLSGNTTFNGCYDINECSVYECVDTTGGTNTSCQTNSINTRTCICPTGSLVTSNSKQSITLTSSAAFSGCNVIDTCGLYQCVSNNLHTTCTRPALNQRTCTCPIGYSTNSTTSVVNGITLNGNETFPGCFDIDECAVYRCTDSLSYTNTTCENLSVDNRTCICPIGYTATNNSREITLMGSTVFEGCTPVPGAVITLADVCDTCCAIENSGESFVLNITEDIIGVDFYLQGLPGWSTGIYVEALSGSFDNGTVISTSPSVSIPASMNAQWITFTLIPVKLEEGITYYIKALPGTGWTYSPYPGVCGDVYANGISYQYGTPDSAQDYSMKIRLAKHCGNGVLDPSYGEVCDGGIGCNSNCRSCKTGYIATYSTACSEINTCSTYGCYSGNITTNCTQPAINQRICTCTDGYSTVNSTSEITYQYINGSTAFGGCFQINYCAIYGCPDSLSTTCKNVALNTRTCTCPLGSTTKINNLSTVTISRDGSFSGCTVTDMCATYKCNSGSLLTTCSQPNLNQRVCTCPIGYSTVSSTSTYNTALLIGNSTFNGCQDINECLLYNCTDSLSLQSTTCINSAINTRTCTCPVGYTASVGSRSITLTGSSLFPGCNPNHGETIVFADACPTCCPISNSGESFVSTITEDLISAEIYLAGVRVATELNIQLLTGSFTGGTVIATSSMVTISANMTAQWITFVFIPTKLNQGTTYYLKGVLSQQSTSSPTVGVCKDNNTNAAGVAYFQGSANSSVDISVKITYGKHCGDGVFDPSYGEMCDGGVGCTACKCDVGYLPNSTIDCSLIDTCATYECKNGSLSPSCSQPSANERICTCPTGYSAFSSASVVSNITITGNASFDGCYEINSCLTSSCPEPPPRNSTIATCENLFNSRNCTCPIGFDVLNESSKTLIIPADVSFPGCSEICGDLLVVRDEKCDDGNTVSGDGCSSNCRVVEKGFRCPVYGGIPEHGEMCSPICGDGLVMGNDYLREACDDGNTKDGDGCNYSTNCTIITPGYVCPTAGILCVELNMCSLYQCSGFPYSGIECAQDHPNQRTCTCPAGYSGTVVLSGNESFSGCVDIDECYVYGCGESDVTCSSSQSLPNWRTCTCPSGTSIILNQLTPISMSLAGNETFPGCISIEECVLYGCGTKATCSQITVGYRQCDCPEGYVVSSTSFFGDLMTSLILSSDQAFPGCEEIPECSTYGCDSAHLANCTENQPNQRTCTCPAGYTGSANLTGTQQFSGCSVLELCQLYGCGNSLYGINCTFTTLNYRDCKCPTGSAAIGQQTLEGSSPFGGCQDINECLNPTTCASTDTCINLSPPTCYLCIVPTVVSTNTIITAALTAFNTSLPGDPLPIQKLLDSITLSVQLTITGWTMVNVGGSTKRSLQGTYTGSFGLQIYVADNQALLLSQSDEGNIQIVLSNALKLEPTETLLTVSTKGILLQQLFVTLSPSPSTSLSPGAYAGIGVAVGVVILAIIIIVILITKKILVKHVPGDISSLPTDVRYFWDIYYKRPQAWERHGNGTSAFYSYKIKRENYEDWQRMWQLFTSIGGSEFEIAEAYAIYNQVLLSNSVNQRMIMETRLKADPNLFKKTDWKNKDTDGLRSWVIEVYARLCKKWEWNNDLDLPIIPTIHGTDASIAWKIAQTGFVALSSLDAGWYGRGIYFTTHAPYSLPYLLKQNPSIVISFCSPGNVYPVIEHPTEKNNLVGAAQAAGYNSHYVLTTNAGYPHKKITDKGVFDELVIGQESQVMPAFILLLNKTNFAQLNAVFAREVVENDVGKDLIDRTGLDAVDKDLKKSLKQKNSQRGEGPTTPQKDLIRSFERSQNNSQPATPLKEQSTNKKQHSSSSEGSQSSSVDKVNDKYIKLSNVVD